MILEFIVTGLFIYCIALHIKVKKLEYVSKYGSPKCERNIKTLWSMSEENKEKLRAHGSRLWEVEHKAGIHPPHVNL
jgi:hypothetical protein